VFDPDKLSADYAGKIGNNDSILSHGSGNKKIQILHDGSHYLALIPKK
jgi:hypothetical protein